MDPHPTQAMDAQEREQLEVEQEIIWELVHVRLSRFEEMLKSASNEELGAIFREYITESAHGGWEGFSFGDLIGISGLLADLERYHRASK